jgi:hypothetical protein
MVAEESLFLEYETDKLDNHFPRFRINIALKSDRAKNGEIVGFHRCWKEFFHLLGYYATLGGLIPTFRDDLFKGEGVQDR